MLKLFSDLAISDNLDEVMTAYHEITSNYLVSVYCERGAFQLSIEGETYHVGEGDLMVGQLDGMSVGSFMRTPDLQGKMMCIGEHLFDDALAGILHLDSQWWKKFLFLKNNPVTHLSEHQNKLYQAYFNLIMTFAENTENPYRLRIIRLTAQSMAVEILHEMNGLIADDEVKQAPGAERTQKDLLFQRFISMLNQHENTEREVKAYAEKLLITPKYLSAVCKEKSGRTALEWITEFTVRNIKYYLLQTDLTVKEIAYKMDFPDVSFFCKYTKKHLGQTPLEFRKTTSRPLRPQNGKEHP